MGEASQTDADSKTYEAGKAAKIGGYARREQDWAFQSNLAAGEITQIFKQLRAAQIREAIAELELKNHRQQMKHAEEIERFLNEEGTEKTGKKTNKAFYAWMKREVKGLYGQVFQFAFDIAKKAERALQHELGDPELSYLQFGYLAGKEGLLAGEKLYLDIKRMEMAYHELNQREYELTKHVSLLQVDPLALMQLRATGRCTVRLPESLFDMDGPGHYFRRIKTVAVSIPVRDRAVRQRQLHTDAAQEQHPQEPARCAATATPAKTPKTTASATTSAACNPSSPAPPRTTAACSRPTCATSAICPSRGRASSASGSWNCRPIPARTTRGSSTTTRSATSSCISATPPGKAAGCCARAPWTT